MAQGRVLRDFHSLRHYDQKLRQRRQASWQCMTQTVLIARKHVCFYTNIGVGYEAFLFFHVQWIYYSDGVLENAQKSLVLQICTV